LLQCVAPAPGDPGTAALMLVKILAAFPPPEISECFRVFQSVAVCCSALHRVAVCCSLLQCVAEILAAYPPLDIFSVLHCVAVCCSALQYVAVCCSALQRFSQRIHVLRF